MSPLYISEKDREAQRAVASILSSHGWDVSTHPDTHTWDLTIRKQGRPAIYVEVKARSITWGEYPDVFIDVQKADAIIRRGVGWFVVMPNDNPPVWFTWLTAKRMAEYQQDHRDVQRHRNDAFDKGDPKYLIPIINFHPLWLIP